MPEWLLAPIDLTRAHDVPALIGWHARVMTLAWGILVPCGIIAARFLKLWPGQQWPQRLDHPGWWHLHRLFQYSAGILMLLGLAFVVSSQRSNGMFSIHALLGWSVVALCTMQFASAWLRGSKGGPAAPAPDGSWRGDHYDMTPRRILFEYIHKFGGYVAIIAAVLAIISGFWQVNAPRWMWIVMAAWWAACLAVFGYLQRRGFAFDTYQAHWGTDWVHPGNRRSPIGFGIHRHMSTPPDA